MQIVVAMNLLIALSAIHLSSSGESGWGNNGPSLSYALATQMTCVLIAMVMCTILSRLLQFLVQTRFQFMSSQAAASDADTSGRSQIQTVEWIGMLIWTSFSLIVTFGFHWSTFASAAGQTWPLLTEVLILVPHVSCLLILWVAGDLGVLDKSVALLDRVRSVLRQQGARIQMILVPVILPILAVYVVREFLDSFSMWKTLPSTTQTVLLSFLAMGTLLLTYPFLLSRIWTSTRLSQAYPNEAERLNEQARQLRLRLSTIECWNTKLRIANAAVVGWIPGIRKILISDVLLRILRPRELEAVFLHEAGHLRHSHVMWRVMAVLFPLLLVLIPLVLFPGPLTWVEARWLAAAGLPVFLASSLLLSWLSKQMELEADRFVWAEMQRWQDPPTSLDNDPLAIALIKTAEVTNQSLHHGSLLHPTTSQRLRQLASLYHSPTQAQQRHSRLQFSKRIILGSFFLLLSTLLTLTCVTAFSLSV